MTAYRRRNAPFNLNQIVQAVIWFIAAMMFDVWFVCELLK